MAINLQRRSLCHVDSLFGQVCRLPIRVWRRHMMDTTRVRRQTNWKSLTSLSFGIVLVLLTDQLLPGGWNSKRQSKNQDREVPKKRCPAWIIPPPMIIANYWVDSCSLVCYYYDDEKVRLLSLSANFRLSGLWPAAILFQSIITLFYWRKRKMLLIILLDILFVYYLNHHWFCNYSRTGASWSW